VTYSRGSVECENGQATTEIVRKPKGQHGFAVVPWRCFVERTFAWLGRHRRLKVDYERVPETTEALIHIAMIRLMVRRLVLIMTFKRPFSARLEMPRGVGNRAPAKGSPGSEPA
jgi:putative transposase